MICYVCKNEVEKLLSNRKCPECMKKYRRDRYEAKKEEILSKNAEYKATHKEETDAADRLWRENNKEKISKRFKEWAKTNRKSRARPDDPPASE